MSNPSNSWPLPSDADVEQWITDHLDMGRVRKTGTGWRSRALKMQPMHEVLSERPARKMLSTPLSYDEWLLVSREMRKQGWTTTRFVRACIGEWMLHHSTVDRRRLPQLTADAAPD